MNTIEPVTNVDMVNNNNVAHDMAENNLLVLFVNISCNECGTPLMNLACNVVVFIQEECEGIDIVIDNNLFNPWV